MLPTVRLNPRSLGDCAEITIARTRHRANRITTNRLTRSGWFVGVIGALLLSPLAYVIVWLGLTLVHGFDNLH
jgi:hypothetical protein